jgi:hypothetical protein
MTIGIDLGDVWSHYCTLNVEGEVVCLRPQCSLSAILAAPDCKVGQIFKSV